MLVAMSTGRARIAAVVMLLATVACTGEPDAEQEPTPVERTTPPSTADAQRLSQPHGPLRVRLERAAGVDRSRRPLLQRSLCRPVDTWMRGGFLAGPYPRRKFAEAFAAWTPRATRLGRGDRDITTNAALGDDLVDVVADRRSARLFVFAPRGRPAGATARVRLRLTGELRDGRVVALVVAGELYLTREGRQWRVFGYDLSREVVR